jgi:general stress protein 26
MEMRRALSVAAALLLCGSIVAPAETPTPSPDPEKLRSAAAELMREARFCALVTLDASGAPQARAMDPFPPEPDLTVWLATNVRTRKVPQIRKDPRVTLYYLAAGGSGYVSLLGEASLVSDPAEKAKRWKPDWKAFYKDENRGPDYVLIRVRPRRVEIVSGKHGIATAPDAWGPAILELH